VRGRTRKLLIGAVLTAAVLLGAAVVALARPSAPAPTNLADTTAPARASRPAPAPVRSHPQVVEPEAGVAAPAQTATTASTSSRALDDAEIRRELKQLKELASQDQLAVGSAARVLADGSAAAPADAPQVVRNVIRTANVIAKTPYLWGGGHGSWSAVGYDCSGSVSFALAGAGLLDAPLTSGALANWGASGPGRWITIYANAGHVFMEVAGLRFDTGGLRGNGTRWQAAPRSTAGFTARHPEGL
jgi:cell wall-associated NlpC family hydrolase